MVQAERGKSSNVKLASGTDARLKAGLTGNHAVSRLFSIVASLMRCGLSLYQRNFHDAIFSSPDPFKTVYYDRRDATLRLIFG